MAVVAACALACVVAGLAVRVLARAAERLGLVDRPSARKHHVGEVPLIGGLAIFLGLLAGALVFDELGRFHWLFLATAAALVVIGAIDDRRGLGVRMRLALQVSVILVMVVFGGVHIHSLGSLFGVDANLGWFGIPFTVIAVIGLLNAFNLIDGIDGLAGGLALVGIVAVLLAGRTAPIHGTALILLLLGCALLPFLAANLGWLGPRNRCFLGDAGSTLLGYVLAWALIRFSQSGHTSLSPVGTLWCVAVPVLDVFAVMYRRIREHRNPFKPDRCHIHYLLLRSGLAPRRALLLMLAVAAGLWTFGMAVHALRLGPGSNLVAFCLVMVVYIALRSRLYQRLMAPLALPAPANDALCRQPGGARLSAIGRNAGAVPSAGAGGQLLEARVVALQPGETETRRIS